MKTQRSPETLERINIQHVTPKSIIWPDGWAAYRHLCQLDLEYQTPWGAVKQKFRHITNKKQAIFNSYLAKYLFNEFKGRISIQFLMTIKELVPIEND
ncbi:hypothetical protein HZS_1310 [Henneguya salminicola]|nr:hypothetical protein HZS_1310 [Henneguya salminicola]